MRRPLKGRPTARITGDWQVELNFAGSRFWGLGSGKLHLDVTPPPVHAVAEEDCGPLPEFKAEEGGWLKGYRLQEIRTQETSAKGLLFPESVRIYAVRGDSYETLEQGKDYDIDPDWGTVGRLSTGGLGPDERVVATYRYGVSRLDTIVVDDRGRIFVREGVPDIAVPKHPGLMEGERRLANLWLPGGVERLDDECFFPVLEDGYPDARPKGYPTVARLLPSTYERLADGRPLRILAWGDSVTLGGFLENPARDRWQEQFVTMLRTRFPRAEISLLTEAWDGSKTEDFLSQPSGAEHNFREKVLAAAPDLVVSEFVNDSAMTAKDVEDRYGCIREEFRRIGAEWIVLSPNYMLPEWMGFTSQKGTDEDPRDYVKGLREFAKGEGVALADAARRWGRLWRQGIPYMTLMLNGINHPDPRGMKLFADALMELF